MKEEDRYEKIEGAIAGGAIGAALGILFAKKNESTIIYALIGAALGATYQAFKESQDLSSGVLYEEDGVLFRELPDGERQIIRQLEKSDTVIPETFTVG